ncbi:MAG TPA: DNA-processing protein DprA [Chitinophagaceae bacterium]|nr:DNA-processing protein DprA [Chitinophagaceae bacterium]
MPLRGACRYDKRNYNTKWRPAYTAFRSKTKPDKHNFPSPNRIVTGMSEATIVIETDIKSRSMITAELANG